MRPDFYIAQQIFNTPQREPELQGRPNSPIKVFSPADTLRLRDYQERDIRRLREEFGRGAKSVLYVAPTGSGKTILFAFITLGAIARDNDVLILAHRRELIEQICKTLDMVGIKYGIIMPGVVPTDAKVQVASVQTIIRRLDKQEKPGLLIIDECHHSTSASYGEIIKWADCRILGVTATPSRLDGRGLKDVFDTLVIGPSIQELIAQGWLAKPMVYIPPSKVDVSKVPIKMGDYDQVELATVVDKTNITGDVIEHYRSYLNDKQALCFCVSVLHAQHVAEQFTQAGIAAASIDGSMNRGERKKIVDDFRSGAIKILTSCELISEGFDVPACSGAILLRPTASLNIFLQQCGRALRVVEGKTEAIILDHVGNVNRHGLPNEDREWTLEGRKRNRASTDTVQSISTCKSCFFAYPSYIKQCPQCGWQPEPTIREINHVPGELVLATGAKLDTKKVSREERMQRMRNADTFAKLAALGKEWRYRYPYGWAKKVLGARNAKRSGNQSEDSSGYDELFFGQALQ